MAIRETAMVTYAQMKNREVAFGIVGIAIGFILGFFVARAVHQGTAAVQSQAPASGQATQQLPEGHPSPQVMEAVRQMEAAAQANPQDKEIRIKLGNSLYDMGRFNAAILWYEEAVKLDPENVNVLTDLGTCYLYTNQPPKAIEMYQRSLKIDPQHPQTLQNLGFTYFSTGAFQKAIQVWEKLLKAHPNYSHADEIRQQIEKAKTHLQGNPSPAK